MRWLLLTALACGGAPRTGVEMVVSPAGAPPELVAEVLRARLHAAGLRRFDVLASPRHVAMRVRGAEAHVARAAVVPGRVTMTWRGAQTPIFDGLVPRSVQCVSTVTGESVAVRMARADGAMFAVQTGGHVGDVLEIAVDGRVVTAPVVQEAIRGGSAHLTTDQAPGECSRLAVQIAGGPLPAGVEVLAERTY